MNETLRDVRGRDGRVLGLTRDSEYDRILLLSQWVSMITYWNGSCSAVYTISEEIPSFVNGRSQLIRTATQPAFAEQATLSAIEYILCVARYSTTYCSA